MYSHQHPATDRPSYAGYLRIPELTSLQHPLTPPDDPRTFRAEHFFITIHQCSELLLRQVILELDAAVECLATPDGDVEDWLESVGRAIDCMVALRQQAEPLGRLPVECFAAFRQRLGTASGAQSAHFHRLWTILGMNGDGPGPLFEGYLRLLDRSGRDLGDLVASGLRGDPMFRMSQALAELAQGVWSWQTTHVHVVTRMIGDCPGTGGTTGLEYLTSRLRMPFPELWAARAETHVRHAQYLGGHVETHSSHAKTYGVPVA
ncbi:tryptophan 2,3-dioxygenase family protein [Dactylosporangium sp. NPDC005555]|uniref:tryptophan 2,3-dioxygenase family protein n=1 Tax=Dactylosporangium sp. NPDC005555 TaxID=3154889 RepID=UPI0033B7F134